MPGMNTLCCGPEDYEYYLREMGREPSSGPPSEECYGYDYEDMYVEEAAKRTCGHHVNNGVSLTEVCDENSHVDGGDNNGEAESTRVIYVPSPKVTYLIWFCFEIFCQYNPTEILFILR